jgi:hypothetical protein
MSIETELRRYRVSVIGGKSSFARRFVLGQFEEYWDSELRKSIGQTD